MAPARAIAWVKRHGVVLQSARGPVPSLAAEVAGERIRGSWWAHPKAHAIYQLAGAIHVHPDIHVCKLVNGRVTFVHRRLWPAMVAGADHFTPEQLAASRSVHTEQGHHELETTPFPDWVTADAMAEAQRLTAREALSALGDWAGQ